MPRETTSHEGQTTLNRDVDFYNDYSAQVIRDRERHDDFKRRHPNRAEQSDAIYRNDKIFGQIEVLDGLRAATKMAQVEDSFDSP
jgi:hypothetical protein